MMLDREKVKAELDEIVEQCRGMDYIGFSTITEHCQNILALLKEQETDIKNLNETIMNLLQKITEMKMIYGDCEYVGELVRCKDCKKRGSWECWQYFFGRIKIPDDWFCADGERK